MTVKEKTKVGCIERNNSIKWVFFISCSFLWEILYMFEKTGQINQHKRIKMLITDGKYMDKISKSRRMFTSIKTNEQHYQKERKDKFT